jgi:hypothetical protein
MRLAPLTALLIAAPWNSAGAAQCPPPVDTRLSNDIAAAYKADGLATLDKGYCSVKELEVRIEHSISEGPARTEHFRTFRDAQAWLVQQRAGGFPVPAVWERRECAKGACRYDGNQLHNHLFLREVEIYPLRNGVFGVRLVLEDGD